MDYSKIFRTELKNVQPYIGGATEDEIKKKYHLDKVVKLGSNENPYAPYKNATRVMKDTIPLLNRYPEGDFIEMKQLIAKREGLKEGNVGLGTGAGNIIETVAKEFLNSGDEVLIAKQSYRLYREVSKLMGAKVIEIPLKEDFQYDLNSFSAHINDKTKLIWICNPNNPTSNVTDKDQLTAFIQSLPDRVVVVIDEAYVDFTEKDKVPDFKQFIGKKPIVLIRTFSKFFGLAGSRLGYLIADQPIIQGYDTATEPFNSNRTALFGAITSLNEDQEQSASVRKQIQDDRFKYGNELVQLGFKVAPSQANFIFAKLPDNNNNATKFCDDLMKKGVIIRDGTPWGYPDWVRITIGLKDEMEFLMGQIRSELK